jgi:hypothetical protein
MASPRAAASARSAVSSAKTKTCTNYRYNENGDCVGMCDEPATVVYSRKNERTGPSEPTVLTYPRCRTHDTPFIQERSEFLGYSREAIE